MSIYRRINSDFKVEIKPFTVKKEGVTYLLPEGVKIIEDSLSIKDVKRNEKMDVKIENESISSDIDNKELLQRLKVIEDDYISMLKKELEGKDRQLQAKDEQIEKQGELLRNFQVLLKEQQGRLDLLEEQIQREEPPVFKPSGGFLSRLKWWKK